MITSFIILNRSELGKGMPRYDAMWLRTPHWLTAPTAEVLRLQRPLPDGSLMVVARGEKSDGFEDEEASPNPADFRLTPV
jgi:hypothetical protein